MYDHTSLFRLTTLLQLLTMALSSVSTYLTHTFKDLALIGLSLALLPLDTFILTVSLLISWARFPAVRLQGQDDPRTTRRRKVLVTGVGMTKGLSLARLFFRAGCDVVGADFEPGGALACGRVSRAIGKFYRLEAPTDEDSGQQAYIRGLLDVVKREQVDLWVSCSGVASAVTDGVAAEVVQRRTGCRVIQFDGETTRMLHEKSSFVARVQEFGLTVPETVEVTGREQVEEVLKKAPEGRKYILKTVGVDDSVRADMTLLPRSSEKETQRHLARLRISEKTPWIVQQFIDGLEFCTHSLVVKGEVKAFIACPSAELLMHYRALPDESPLSKAMLVFTKAFAEKSGSEFTGHLSFDFLVEREDLTKKIPEDITLYPIECNPRAHTAVALFDNTPELVEAYLSVLEPPAKPSYADVVDVDPSRHVVTPRSPAKYYWSGHDFVTWLILPVINLFLLRISISDFIGSLDSLLDHIVFWKDGTYEVWDPLPWWWLYHIYWPLRVWDMFVRRKRWSRVNVSTGKIFEC